MRNILLAVGVAGLVGLFSACGSKDHPSTLPDSPSGGKQSFGGRTSTAGKNSGGSVNNAGGAGGDAEGGAGTNALAPTVTITYPTNLDDPNQDGVLSGADVEVTCEVTQSTEPGSSAVNAAAVTISIVGADGKVIEQKIGSPTKHENEFSADFQLTAVPAGQVGFSCTGEDMAKHQASDKVTTLLDQGPTITFVQPVADSAHALSQPLDVEFTVDPSPLTKKDNNAAVDTVTLEIAGQPIDLAKASDKPGHYRLQVNLADPKLFTPAPSGTIFVSVTATNQRTPTGVEAKGSVQTAIDGAAPIITITNPVDKQVVGGKVKLTFTASDAVSGVDPQTIVVTLNMIDYPYDARSDSWSVAGDTYTFEFDSRQINDARFQITVNVGATDKVGNMAAGTSELLYLDNYPPDIDLDPENVRAITLTDVCSVSFDPVGPAAKNDLEHVVRAGIFRAVVWDATNEDKELPVPHFAKTNEKSVHLYLEEDAAKPLLIDTDKDGKCDDVAEVDSTNSLQLLPVPKQGQMWFGPDDATPPGVSGLGCTTSPSQIPDKLCTNAVSDMRQVIQDEFNGIPVIYAASPTQNSPECTGVTWEFAPKLTKNGWVCFATRAVDNVGNVGVSRPIRLCVNDPDLGAEPPCANSSDTPPDCTDGCTTAPRWGNNAYLWK